MKTTKTKKPSAYQKLKIQNEEYLNHIKLFIGKPDEGVTILLKEIYKAVFKEEDSNVTSLDKRLRSTDKNGNLKARPK